MLPPLLVISPYKGDIAAKLLTCTYLSIHMGADAKKAMTLRLCPGRLIFKTSVTSLEVRAVKQMASILTAPALKMSGTIWPSITFSINTNQLGTLGTQACQALQARVRVPFLHGNHMHPLPIINLYHLSLLPILSPYLFLNWPLVYPCTGSGVLYGLSVPGRVS